MYNAYMGAGKGKTMRVQISRPKHPKPKKYVLDDGTIEYRLKNGELHRVPGPAIECPNGAKEWYLYDRPHRVGAPAFEYTNGDKEWCVRGNYHRIGGPAVELANGEKWWLVNNKYHRVDGPAKEHADGSKTWYVNGKRHREDGPAVERADGTVEYWLVGRELSFKEWAILTDNYAPLKPKTTDSGDLVF